MPDVTINGRALDTVSANIKVRKRNDDGEVVTLDRAAFLADTDLHATMGITANTTKTLKTGYAQDGGNNYLDEDGNNLISTWQSGKSPSYLTEIRNTNLFNDAT